MRKQKYFKSGEAYSAAGKYREASIQFENAIKIDPAYAEAHFQLAETCLKLQQADRAEQELARVLELAPDNNQARIEYANVLILVRNFQQAQSEIDILLRDRPNDPTTHSVVSSLLAGEGDLTGAIQEMEKAIALAPDRWESQLSLALLQLKDNQPEAAEANLKKVTQLNSSTAQAYFTLGSFYQSRGQLGQAEEQFQHAIELDQRNPDLRAALARVYLAEGKQKQAEDFVRQAKLDFADNSAGYRLLAEFYVVTGDSDKALAEYKSLRQQYPKDVALKKNYIELLLQNRRFSEAQQLIDELLKENPKDKDALVYRSQLQISNGHANDSIGALQNVIKSDPNNSEAHYVLGVAFDNSGNLNQAVSEWQEAVRLRPDLLDPQRSLAGAAMRQGDNSGLENTATQLINISPASPEGYALRALANINRNRFSEAEKDARQAIAIAPNSALGYVQMGNLNLAQKQYGEAANYFRQALERNSNSTDALRGLTDSYLNRKKPDEAIAAINAQIAKSPDNSQFYSLLGTTLFHEKKDVIGAEAALTKSVELDHNNLGAVMNLGEIAAYSGQTGRAIALYEGYLKTYPREPALYILLGRLYEAKKQLKQAEDAYQKALVIRPDDPIASNSLANVMVNQGANFDQALVLAQTAQRKLPDSPAVADTLGWIYYHKGAYPVAVSFLEQAIKLTDKSKLPDTPDMHYHLGLAYQKTDQPRLARQQLERVLKINPHYVAAEDIKAQLAKLKS